MSIKKSSSGKYQVRFRDENGRQRAKSFIRKKDAEAFETKIKIEIKDGAWLDPAIAHVPLREVWADFSELKKGKKLNTQVDYENIWRVHIEPEWGKVSVARIEQTSFDKWVIARKLSPSRIDKIHLVMSMLLDHAVKRKNLKNNPLKNVLGKRSKENLPKCETEIADNYLSLTELLAVAEVSGYYQDVILVLGMCGLRWGELVGLQVKDLNVAKGQLTIRRSLVEINGKLFESTTKSYRWRIVDMPEVLRSVCHRWVFEKDPDDPLFHTPTGTFLRNTNFTRRVFIPALMAAEVKKIRIHDLRHTAASVAISAGATPIMVKELLGHSDVQLTMRIYAHIFEADRAKVAENLNKAVYEVQQKCTESSVRVSEAFTESSKTPSDQHFSGNVDKEFKLGTSNYEFWALTN